MQLRLISILVFVTAAASFGQTSPAVPFSMLPRNAQSVLYFPHLTEGGPDTNNSWQATFSFVNTNNTAANVSVAFYNDDGSSMMLDFGSGPVSSLTTTIPSQGTRSFQTQLTHKGPQPVWGWAAGQSDVPIFAQMNYRNNSNGHVAALIAANATTGTAQWTSTASAKMGIAVANPSPADTMTYMVKVTDSEGADLGSKTYQLPPRGHDAFNLGARFTLPTDFAGSVEITGQTASLSIYKPAIWTVGSEMGAFATLPDGRALLPEDQMSRAMRVWGRIKAMTLQMGYKVNPSLTLMPGTTASGIANAMGGMDASGNEQVTMYMSMVEIVGDSDGELAFLMAHEMAHVIQCKTNGCKVAVDPQMGSDYESDADELGMMLSTSAGYDSFSAAGAYSKLQMGNGQMAMGSMGMATVWEDQTSNNPHDFFASRINKMFQVQQRMCTNTMFSTNCAAFKNLMHPSTGSMNMPM